MIVCGVAKTVGSKVIELADASGVGRSDGLAGSSSPGPANRDALVVFTTKLVKFGPALVSANDTAADPGGGRQHGVTAGDVVGPGGDGGLAAATVAETVKAIHRPAVRVQRSSAWARCPRGDDEVDDAAVDRLQWVVGRHGHRERVGEHRADGGRLRVLPATGVSVKPWLSKAPMSVVAVTWLAALILRGDGARRWRPRRWPGCRATGPRSGSARRSCPAGRVAG